MTRLALVPLAVYAAGFVPVAAIGAHTHWHAYHQPGWAAGFGALCGIAWPYTVGSALWDVARGRA